MVFAIFGILARCIRSCGALLGLELQGNVNFTFCESLNKGWIWFPFSRIYLLGAGIRCHGSVFWEWGSLFPLKCQYSATRALYISSLSRVWISFKTFSSLNYLSNLIEIWTWYTLLMTSDRCKTGKLIQIWFKLLSYCSWHETLTFLDAFKSYIHYCLTLHNIQLKMRKLWQFQTD